MSAQRIEEAEIHATRSRTSDRDDTSLPPSSGVSRVVPPPPSQMVAVLQEYETTARESFPSFSDIKGPFTIELPPHKQGATDYAGIAATQPAARSSRFTMAAVAIAALIAGAILSTLLRK